jgi:hypothetical protein
MANQQVPPKSRPFNFTKPLVDETGRLSDEHQQAFTSIQQRLDGPVSTAAGAVPANSAAPGLPGAIITDGSFLYVNIGGSWVRVAVSTF